MSATETSTAQAEEATTGDTLHSYVTPSQQRANNDDADKPNEYGPHGEHKWSEMYGANQDPGKGDWPQCLLILTEAEVHKLSVITLRVKQEQVRGGRAPTHNLKKCGVVTAHWRRDDVALVNRV